MSRDTCVCCGDEIPEGRQVCPLCEKRTRDVKHEPRQRIYRCAYLITKLFKKIQQAF